MDNLTINKGNSVSIIYAKDVKVSHRRKNYEDLILFTSNDFYNIDFTSLINSKLNPSNFKIDYPLMWAIIHGSTEEIKMILNQIDLMKNKTLFTECVKFSLKNSNMDYVRKWSESFVDFIEELKGEKNDSK